MAGTFDSPGNGIGGRFHALRRLRRLHWALAILALLALVTAGGVRVYTLPITPWDSVCASLEQQRYAETYSLFSPRLRAELPLALFTHTAEELDQVEGIVVGCSSHWLFSPYRYALGPTAGPLSVTLRRVKTGNQSGTVGFTWDRDRWTLDAISAGVLGISIQALSAVDNFCAAASAGDYTQAYALLGRHLQAAQSRSSYATAAQLQDAAQGRITHCQPVTVAEGNTDQNASLILGISRAIRGQLQGAITLAEEAGAWRVNTIAPNLIGFDMSPLAVARTFCNAVAADNSVDIMNMLVRDDTFSVSLSEVKQVFALPSGDHWTGCDFHLTTYNVAGSLATVNANLNMSAASGERFYAPIEIGIAKEDGAWGLFFVRSVNA